MKRQGRRRRSVGPEVAKRRQSAEPRWRRCGILTIIHPPFITFVYFPPTIAYSLSNDQPYSSINEPDCYASFPLRIESDRVEPRLSREEGREPRLASSSLTDTFQGFCFQTSTTPILYFPVPTPVDSWTPSLLSHNTKRRPCPETPCRRKPSSRSRTSGRSASSPTSTTVRCRCSLFNPSPCLFPYPSDTAINLCTQAKRPIVTPSSQPTTSSRAVSREASGFSTRARMRSSGGSRWRAAPSALASA